MFKHKFHHLYQTGTAVAQRVQRVVQKREGWRFDAHLNRVFLLLCSWARHFIHLTPSVCDTVDGEAGIDSHVFVSLPQGTGGHRGSSPPSVCDWRE